jgi:hypothetical protein
LYGALYDFEGALGKLLTAWIMEGARILKADLGFWQEYRHSGKKLPICKGLRRVWCLY